MAQLNVPVDGSRCQSMAQRASRWLLAWVREADLGSGAGVVGGWEVVGTHLSKAENLDLPVWIQRNILSIIEAILLPMDDNARAAEASKAKTITMPVATGAQSKRCNRLRWPWGEVS